MRKLLALATAVSLSACSFGIKRLPDDYDPRTEPRCEPDDAAPVLDIIGALIVWSGGAALAIWGHDAEDGTSKWGPVMLSGAVGGLFAVAAAVGISANRNCYAARDQWDERQIEQDNLVKEAKRAKKRKAAEPAFVPPPTVVAPRGFFCSSSPTVADAGFCVRDKAECQRTRDAAVAGVADLAECVLTERAFCFGDRCAPGMEACQAMRQRTIGPDGTAAECADSE